VLGNDAGEAFGQGIANGIFSKGKDITDAATRAVSAAGDLQFSLGVEGEQAGEAFGQGMANGIFSKIGDLEVAGAFAAQAAIDASNRRFARSSPSKVGQEIGADFSAGIAIGIESSAKQVADASTRAVTSAVTAASAAAARTPINLNLLRSDVTAPQIANLRAGVQPVVVAAAASPAQPPPTVIVQAPKPEVAAPKQIDAKITINKTDVDPLHFAQEIGWRLQ
jgi:hypothetical protein